MAPGVAQILRQLLHDDPRFHVADALVIPKLLSNVDGILHAEADGVKQAPTES